MGIKIKEMQKLFIVLILSFITQVDSQLYAQGADCCDREAILYCEYNHALMGNTAREKIEKEFSAAVFAKFQEIFNRNCFRVILPMPLDASNIPQNEYQIEVIFTQVTNITKWPNTSIIARLYFEHEGYNEHVHYWEVEEPGDSLTMDKISWPSFLDKLVSKIKNGPEITDIVEKFEKRPVTLEVGCDKEEFEPGEVISLYLLGFKDKYGQTSREFNRIVVQVSAGEIINEAPIELGPDYYAFNVEGNLVELKYKVPENCKNPSVKFTIYNSCDVLSENILWINKTQTKDRLMEKDFALNCYDAKISVTGKYDKTLTTSDEDTKKEHIQKRKINETIDASATIYLTLTTTQDMPIFNQTWKYYQPASVTITSFNHNYKENKYMAGPNYETNVDITRITKTYKLEGEEYITQFPPWMLVIDNETMKAVKLIPAGYGIEYEFNETEEINSVQGNKKDSKTTTKTSSKSFKLGPVGEKGPDPTVKKSDTWIQDYLKRQGIELPPGTPIPNIPNDDVVQETQPDVLVKYGDGKYSFGGEGRRRIPKELEYGSEEVNLSYNWQMTVKKKK